MRKITYDIPQGVREVAHWESRGGAYWITLWKQEGTSYAYRGKGCGGILYGKSDSEAVAALGDISRFQPDANRTPMHRIVPSADLEGI